MTSVIYAKDEKVIRSIFIHYDKDNDNKLTFNEFKELCKDLGFELYDFQFEYLDTSEEGTVSYEEFKSWWIDEDKLNILLEKNIDNINYAHDMYKKGIEEYKVLNYENFSKMIDKYYESTITEDEFKKYNLNGNGILEFNEFLKWLRWI
ncbi:EF-hand domain-containing protein [Fadolivirus algeromassiliense]|jgi:Ca2+-binding EF-hand superfamily protein|uniref:EF-hand domain-containing protein n=1 Tax=Fadolivirus FV1/VV64 TaxID=3070911 RepID=A0A7D3R334_9VIRU|nr:EF-hand domain-containing protein [Fadolivirus algeromassiliense]QKF94858.1 EF-hand domain-containing protein [Fadolivirus FV1/VV64]